MTHLASCPCDVFVHPRAIDNPPGRLAVSYRVGDFLAFRRALLRSLPGEGELAHWRPGAEGDLAVQMIEWWAYLADVLTFYSERIANEDYIRTAVLSESVERLVRLLGYRPRPGIGARGVVAAVLAARKAVAIPAGFQIQSKPGPGQSPQTFEVDAATNVAPPEVLALDVPASPLLVAKEGVLLSGRVNTVKKGDLVLLFKDAAHARLLDVRSVEAENDPSGGTNSRVTFVQSLSEFSAELAAEYRLLKSQRTARPWQGVAAGTTVIGTAQVVMESLTRDILPGDPIVFEGPSLLEVAPVTNPTVLARRAPGALSGFGPIRKIVSVTGYGEAIWFANGNSGDPTLPPAPGTPPIPILHSFIQFGPELTPAWNDARTKTIVRFGWRDVGELIGTPAVAFTEASGPLTVKSSPLPIQTTFSVQIESDDDTGIEATAQLDQTTLALGDLPEGSFSLEPPLRALRGLLPVSRGETVRGEVLGSGNAASASQEFVLQKSPLTYLLNGDAEAGESYKSTLRVWVNGIEWTEAPSFYAQGPDARVFVTREDVDQKTHVLFGDGIDGARLPTSTDNVTARYRFGSGADAPAAGALTVVTQPLPGLQEIRNPVAVGGGADRDPPAQIRRYAPRSVLTFGRAVSRDDYETVAAQTPGVRRARAYWSFDSLEQRALVTVYVGDDASAVRAARVALSRAGDPNRPVTVRQARAVPLALALALRIEASREAGAVIAGVTSALADPEGGLFGADNVRIGAMVFHSRIHEVCLSVDGVLAVHALRFAIDPDQTGTFQNDPGFRHDPGEGRFYQLDAQANLQITQEGLADG